MKDNNSPFFSVIVPAYNSESYIDKCVLSVIGQTFKDFELMLVDDGSKDNTLKKIKDFQREDSRIIALHQENGGHTSARNYGLENSCGKYIVFLDSDDYLDSNVLEACAEAIETHSPDLIVYDIKYTDTRIQKKNNFPYGVHTVDNELRSKLLMPDDGIFAFPKTINGKVFRREKIYDVQMNIPNDILVGEDGLSFVCTAMRCDRVCILNDICYNYFVRKGSVSHSGDEFSLRRSLICLNHYRKTLEMNGDLAEQFSRFVITNIYAGVLHVIWSEKDIKWLRNEYDALLSNSYISEAIKNAYFYKCAYKERAKQFLLKHRLFRTIKFVTFIKEKIQKIAKG